VSVSDTLGVALLVLGMMMQAGFTLVSFKLAFILVTLFLSGPVASHALARAALHDGQRPLLAGRDGKLRETDPVELFPELQGRLGHPLSSETNDPDTAAAVAAAPEREARPSNS
jgi:hypothetical protein